MNSVVGFHFVRHLEFGMHPNSSDVLLASSTAEPVPLKRIVELALDHATAGSIAAADQQHTDALYRDLRSSYIPQLFTGAGLGFSASTGLPSFIGALPAASSNRASFSPICALPPSFT